MSRIQNLWVECAKVLPADAPPIQHIEMRRAFFAGAYATIDEIRKISDVPDTDAAEKAAALEIESMVQECEAFFADVARGHA